MVTIREILFKAKRIDNGEWIFGLVPKIENEFCLIREYGNNVSCECDINTLCQFTGLRDKNGQKIWENDIVEIHAEDGYFLIQWSDTEARWDMVNEIDGFVVDFDNYWSYEVEVVGNVIDNPDLIGRE